MQKKTTTQRKLAVGVMQGRLLPKYLGRYQAHPVSYWQKEFALARELRLDLIEFIFDLNDWATNPLLTKDGIAEIEEISKRTAVSVKTICADYFMLAPLFGVSEKEIKVNLDVMERLLGNAYRLGVSDIGIACLEKTSLKSNPKMQLEFINNLGKLIPLAEELQINFSLELDLNPEETRNLLSSFDSDRIKITYDTGNSASFGYDPAEELATYGSLISDIHIKDRLLNGESVKLGTGSTDFERFLNSFENLNYSGPVILQAFRDDEGLNIFREQFQWLKQSFVQHGYQLGINN